MKFAASSQNPARLFRSLLVGVLVLAALPVTAQNRYGPSRSRDKLAQQREQSFDAGDFYLTPDGKRPLDRLAGAVVVQVHEALDRAATVKGLAGAGAALEGYAVDFESPAGFTVLKASATVRQLHLGQPKVLQDTIAGARQAAVLRSANPLFIDGRSGHWLIPTTNIIVCLRTNVNPRTYFGAEWSRARRLGGTEDQFVLALTTSAAEEMLADVNRRAADARILWAQPDFVSQEIPQTLDPLYAQQWHLHNTGQTGATPGADIHAEEAWAITTGNSNIIIAVVDDAIQIDHPDLSANIYTNPGEVAGNGVDDDHNGYKDDVHGWNFGANSNDPRPTAGSEDNHGTQTAGLAVAAANNNLGVAGVAYGCKLLPVTGLQVYDSQRAESFYYAAGRGPTGQKWRGADVINFSVTRSQASVIDAALHWAATSGRGGKGCPIFCSSGNDAAGWYQDYITITNAGPHTITWEYDKDGSGAACSDTFWLDSIIYPDGALETFEGGGLPAGWSTGGSSEPWSIVQDGVDGNHAVIGWNGAGSHALRAGKSGNNGYSWVEVLRDMPAGNLLFYYWVSSQTNHDYVTVWIDDDAQWSYSGCLSGNTAVQYPASSADTIAVGASTDFDYRADFSDYGATLDFVAPGGGGLAGTPTTDRTGTDGDNPLPSPDGDYSTGFTGTSASSPIAAGVAALVLSINPGLTAAEIRTMMRRGCDQVGGVTYNNGFHPQYGYGRVNAYRALTNAYADLQIAIQPSRNPAVVGSNLVCTLTISNAGPASAAGISLTNVFSDDVTFVSASPAATLVSARTIAWNKLARVPAKTSLKVTLTVRPRANGTLASTAIVASSAPELDFSNNTATSLIPAVDLARPALTLITPISGQRIMDTVAEVTVVGKASDNVRIANVQFQLNGGDWFGVDTTNHWANWTATLTPAPGTNTINAFATDASGNYSLTNKRSFDYVVPSTLTLVTNGIGGISRSFKGNMLEVGRTYKVTAVPGAGQVFSNWVGDAASSLAALTFVMQSNMTLTANFIPNPFLRAKGLYTGLFGETDRVHERSGFFKLTLADHGAYSASLKRGTNTYPFSGQFEVSGAASKSVKGWLVNLNLDLAGAEKLAGTVSSNDWAADLQANRYVFSSLANPANQFKGKFTLIIPGVANTAASPAGHGYGAVTVGPNGYVTLSGTLADNTGISQNVPLSREGEWACYVPLYGGQGSIWSWLRFDTNQPSAGISGALSWIKPARPGTVYYSSGITNNDAPAQGARYTPPANATTRVIDLTNGVVIFDGGNLDAPFTNIVTLTSGNHLSNPSPNSLSFSVTPANGIFSGRVNVPDTTRTNTFKGAFLQDQDAGYGFFLDTNQSGSVFLGAPGP